MKKQIPKALCMWTNGKPDKTKTEHATRPEKEYYCLCYLLCATTSTLEQSDDDINTINITEMRKKRIGKKQLENNVHKKLHCRVFNCCT